MINNRSYLFSCIFSFLYVSLFLFLFSRPLWAEESKPKKSDFPHVESREILPPTPHVYTGDQEGVLNRFIYIANIDGAYSLSHQSGSGDTNDGGYVSGILAPRYRFSDSLSFTFMYNGNYHKELDFYSDNVGPKATSERQGHTFTPMVKFRFGEGLRYFLMPSFFHTRTYNKDVEGGGWSDGLYNYRDYGGGVDFGVEKLGFGNPDNGSLRIGVQYYERQYPNYVSLLDLAGVAGGNNSEPDERDYDGILTKIAYQWKQRSGFSWGVDYFFLYKDLVDKKVVDVPSGVLSSDEQVDYWHSFTLRFWYDFPDIGNRLRLGLDLNGSLYDSNQNYYDGMGNINPADDTAMSDFYDYFSYRVRPNIFYAFELYPLTARLYYSYQKLDYDDRLAQRDDAIGTYKSEKQWERQHATGLNLRYQLLENLGIYGEYQYVDVSSNNDYLVVYEYDHTVHTFYLGLSLRL